MTIINKIESPNLEFLASASFFITGRVADVLATRFVMKNDLEPEFNFLTNYFVSNMGIDNGLIAKNALVCLPFMYVASKFDDRSKANKWLLGLGIASYAAAYSFEFFHEALSQYLR